MNKKRLLAAATSALCFASTFAVMPEIAGMRTEATEAVFNDFEETYEGWHSSDYDSEFTVVDGIGVGGSRGALISERTSSEAGAVSSKGFYLWGGIKYNYSMMVYSETDEVFHVSLLYKDETTDEATTVELATQKVKAGEWTNISTSYKAPDNTYEYEITVTTESTNDFVLDNVSITTKESTALKAEAAKGNGLKDYFKGYGFRVGNIFNGQTIKNSAIQATILKDCDAIECENETKADALLGWSPNSNNTDTNVIVSLNSCSAIADFCVKNNLGFRGHAIVWHSQTPDWFFKQGFNNNNGKVSASVMDQRLESYIKNTFAAWEREYPTLDLYAYDVCNECINDGTGGARNPGINGGKDGVSAYVDVYGDNSFIEKAFTWARQYAPAKTKLYYNDFNEFAGTKKNGIINTILKPLSQKGVLDGMGMQSHIDAAATNAWGDTVSYLAAMDEYLSLGIDVQVTELDISLANGQTLQQQADKYKAILQHIVEVNTSGKYKGKVTLFQVWGPNDANTWISGDKSPLLYDKNNQPKAAYNALKEYGEPLPEGPFEGFDTPAKEPEVDADGYWFHHTFEGTTHNWDGRGAASVATSGAQYYAGKEALAVRDREAEWNGAQFTLGREFKAGEEYSFSVNYIYTDGDDTRDFKLTLEYYDPDKSNDDGTKGGTTWAEIATGTTSAGTWVQLSNTNFKLPANGSSFKIIVETTDGSLENFYIDEAIGAPAGTKIPGPGQPAVVVKKFLLGDTDFDGKLTATDMVNERKAVLGKITDNMTIKNADVDQSGEVQVNDLVLLSEFLLGKIKEFPDNRPAVDFSSLEAQFKNISIGSSLKKDGEHNAIFSQRFGADPGWMVYKDRIYVFTTNDTDEYNATGGNKSNGYSYIKTLSCHSSADLVNWTDHGVIPVAGNIAKWAGNSWAPDACWKTINGKDKFFLYFANSGGGIGVLTADSPEGPWTDPLGHALVTGSTPNCSSVIWMFDPAVLVDDDGTGYLYFGGGVPSDNPAHPKTGRCVKLGDDMISLAGTPVTMDTPYLFEDSSIIKEGDTYYYSYCTNWNTGGNPYGFGNAEIAVMTSKNPLGPFEYKGIAFKNQASFGMGGGNNHHSIVKFKDKFYILYHGRVMESRLRNNGSMENLNDYRSTHMDECTFSNGMFSAKGTMAGVKQVEDFNPYTTVPAGTFANQSKGIEISGQGKVTVSGKKGDWLMLSQVNMKNGVSSIKATGKGGAVKFCVGSPDGEVIGYADLSSGSSDLPALSNISGTKNVYIVFGADTQLNSWSFA